MDQSDRDLLLGEIHGTVKAIREDQTKHEKVFHEHDKRLRSLEGSRKWFIGAAAILGYLINLFTGNKHGQ